MTSFTGRVAVVTGGTKGIGRAVAARFEAAGATVVTLARTEPAQPVGRFIAADLACRTDIAAAFQTIAEEFGRVDVLVNNAGGARPGRALDYPEAAARAAFDLNVLGALYASQCMYPLTPEHGGASIVNIGSVAGTRPSPGTAVYGAAKAALASLTKSLALEWAPRVRVNCVVPGPVLTESLTAFYGGPEAAALVGRGCRRDGWPSPGTSPGPACTWPPTTPARFPARNSWCTAAARPRVRTASPVPILDYCPGLGRLTEDPKCRVRGPQRIN